MRYFIYNAISADIEKAEDPGKHLNRIRDEILNMAAVRIVSNTEEDSYTIFEILNARGQELEPHELLKNYIMRYIRPDSMRDDVKSTWEEMEQKLGKNMGRYVKHYVTHKFGEITKQSEKDPYKVIKRMIRGQDMQSLLEDIKLKSEYYDRIINPDKYEGISSETETRIFRIFRKKRFEQFRPVLLSLIHQAELGSLSADKYDESIRFIYSFFVCYTIIGEEKSNKLNDAVKKYANQLEMSYSDELLEEFAKSMKDKMPSFDVFLNAFKNIGWSKHSKFYSDSRDKERVRIVLELVEQYFSKSDSVPDFSIEHMKPDSEGSGNSWIGNLIPIEERINRGLKNKSLSEKIRAYANSSFATARRVAERHKDGNVDIGKRTEYLAKLVYNDILNLNNAAI